MNSAHQLISSLYLLHESDRLNLAASDFSLPPCPNMNKKQIAANTVNLGEITENNWSVQKKRNKTDNTYKIDLFNF